MCITRVRHARVPQPQVADQNIPPVHVRLHGRPHASPGRQNVVGDPRDPVGLAVDAQGVGRGGREDLLVPDRGVDVRAQPELGGTVDDADVAQGHVGDEVVGVPGVVKGRVFVDGLPKARGAGDGRIGGKPVPDGLLAEVSGGSWLGTLIVNRYVIDVHSEYLMH